MKIEGKSYKTIWFENNLVKIIDQTKLPHQFIIKDLKTVQDAINAIKIMEVRGAPLIGATAAYGLVLSIIEKNDLSFLKKSSEELIVSRPTAINLKWAAEQMVAKLLKLESSKRNKAAFDLAKEFEEKDIRINQKIGNNGFEVIKKSLPKNVEMTHKSLFDDSVEGIKLKNKPVFSVQYHPESNPGPQDSHYLFNQFINEIKKNAQKKRY